MRKIWLGLLGFACCTLLIAGYQSRVVAQGEGTPTPTSTALTNTPEMTPSATAEASATPADNLTPTATEGTPTASPSATITEVAPTASPTSTVEEPASADTDTSASNANTITGNTLITETRPFSEELLAQLQLPEGFEINVFAQNLGSIRMMAVAPDGTLLVTRREEGDVIALFDTDQDGVADVNEGRVVASGLPLVHGIAIHQNRLYLATDKQVLAADLMENGTIGVLQVIIDDLPDGGQHPNRTMAFGPDGLLYITIGSPCNDCRSSNLEYATMLRVSPDGLARRIYSSGLRNTLGFGWHPETGELWGMDHGSDWRGDNNPPEELNSLQPDANYGWPYCFGAQQPDVYSPAAPPNGMTKEEFCATTVAPVLEYQAHSAPIGMVFYTGDQFPAEYQNDAFVAMRGSWNRQPATGYEVVRIHFENGQPISFEPFLSGFLIENGTAHFARVAGVAVAADGSLLITDDTNGVIYRVSYTGQ